MFDKEFYPTPKEVLELMGIDCNGKKVLEPSAGSGNIVSYLKDNNASLVLGVEKNNDLKSILEKKCRVINTDIFNVKKEDVSHIDMVVMNPPFSNASKHILHCYEISPEGTEIIALCNSKSLEGVYGEDWRILKALIQDVGVSVDLGDCFKEAERKTGVEVALIKLYKPVIYEKFKFDGFYMDEEEYEDSVEGITPFNEVKALVQRYIGSMNVFAEIENQRALLQNNLGDLKMGSMSFTFGYSNKVATIEEFSKELKKTSWNYIIDKTGIRKFATNLTMEGINKMVENQSKIPFTMKNVYYLLNMIVQTRGQQFNLSLEMVIDKLTKHISDNRYNLEGWKTNLGSLLNKKIIIPHMVSRWSNEDYVSMKHTDYCSSIDDLMKVMCYLKGDNYDLYERIYHFKPNGDRRVRTGVWYDWGFFDIRFYYKGTMHMKFKNIKDWELLNRKYGEIKGFILPEKL